MQTVTSNAPSVPHQRPKPYSTRSARGGAASPWVGRSDSDASTSSPTRPQSGYRTPPPTGYGSGPVQPATTDRMTVDDVVVRTVGLLALTGISAALAWTLVPVEYTVGTWIGAAMIGLVIGLVISF